MKSIFDFFDSESIIKFIISNLNPPPNYPLQGHQCGQETTDLGGSIMSPQDCYNTLLVRFSTNQEHYFCYY